ncbi:sensor of ECF-type sigma factor [Aquimarina mytili]|uniref:Sensor of ECF-type sigma factor n=1 Tax=Aquimarina mytili TaxID=874423 RepID=A0A936ZUC4_9FLAO|nr:sensor of ECF-type sigma factor [Aquimarina mytili]MBL0684472.1 sensor of ECF-type sigma factor [Aquimarina mytili]
MKKIFLLICIAFTTYSSFAQNGPRERMKAFKVAYITEKLNLTSKEAQQFWPIYNAHEKTVENLKRKGRKLIKGLQNKSNGPDGLNDAQAGEFLSQYMDNEEQKSKARQALISDLKKILPNMKILKLIKAESDFNKRILERIRERRKMN